MHRVFEVAHAERERTPEIVTVSRHDGHNFEEIADRRVGHLPVQGALDEIVNGGAGVGSEERAGCTLCAGIEETRRIVRPRLPSQ
jgi:hypothetical protein